MEDATKGTTWKKRWEEVDNLRQVDAKENTEEEAE